MTTQTAEQALTHHVRLILMNDEPLYRECRNIVRAAATPRYAAGEALKDYVESICFGEDGDLLDCIDGAYLIREVLTTALAFVDWTDLADDFREED